MKKVLILTVLLASVPVLGFSQTAYTVNNAAAWTQAVNGIRNGGNNKEYAITVTGAVSVPPAPNNVNTFGSVTGVTVTIAGNGTLSPSGNGCLLQIGARQTVVARDLTLRGRSSNNASVVDIASGGTFRMEGNATVSGNTEANRNGIGGGVYVDGDFIMQDRASVKNNTARNKNGGGVYVGDGGTFTMRGNASVSGNTARGYGGGVYIGKKGTFTMLGGTISGNTVSRSYEDGDVDASNGGGVFNEGTFAMQGGTISDNTAVFFSIDSNFYFCGGVSNNGTFAMQGGTISGNSGSGVSNGGTFTMQGGTISGNNDSGVWNGGIFTMRGSASIFGNTTQHDSLHGGGGVGGGGVLNDGIFTMQDNASVSGNTAINGGGVYVGERGTFTMQGGTISGNTARKGYQADSIILGSGGGVCVGGGIFTMEGGTISGNTAQLSGGGVDVGGTFTKTGGTIHGDDTAQNLRNTVVTRLGHAVYEAKNKGWRNASAGPAVNTASGGFWLNDGDVVTFPSGFKETWKRSNFSFELTITENTMNTRGSDYVWVLQSISDNTYTLKRADAANTKTLTIRLDGRRLVISGDSDSGEDNWNGTWRELEW